MALASEEKVWGTTSYGARVQVVDHHDNVGSPSASASADTDWAAAKRMESENENKVLGTTSSDARVPAHKRMVDRIGSIDKSLVRAPPYPIIVKLPDGNGITFNREAINDPLLVYSASTPMTITPTVIDHWLQTKRMESKYSDVANGPSVDTGLVGAQPCPNIVMLPDDNGNVFNSENINNPCLMASASTRRTLTSIVEAHWEKAKRTESKYPPRPLSPDKLAHDAACS